MSIHFLYSLQKYEILLRASQNIENGQVSEIEIYSFLRVSALLPQLVYHISTIRITSSIVVTHVAWITNRNMYGTFGTSFH
jgi:hypothetical protein